MREQVNTVIEDMSDRFEYEKQEEIVGIIAEVLGEFPAPPEHKDEGDNGSHYRGLLAVDFWSRNSASAR